MWQRRILTFLKWTFIVISIPLLLGAVFMWTSPQFGGVPSDEDIVRYESSGHYNKEKEIFENLENTSMDISLSDMPQMLSEWFRGDSQAEPPFELPMEFPGPENLGDSSFHFIWFGHSALWMSLGGKSILIDPMLTEVPAPHSMLGPSRFNPKVPIEIEDLPHLDYVLISHDHYDHLDYKTIVQIAEKTDLFLVPLGVGMHFISWGIPDEKILELNWWDTFLSDDLRFDFVPSRHFSGRGLADRNTTLWGGWTLRNEEYNLFFTGDGGYGDHFKSIGDSLGPFDIAWIECGQYNPLWAQIHMMPEQSVLAAQDVKAKRMMPIHWGAFSLAPHAWDDPVLRVTTAAKEKGMPIGVPIMGHINRLDSVRSAEWLTYNPWWVEK